MRTQLFDSKSKKLQREGGTQPLPLFDRPESVIREEIDEAPSSVYNRKKGGRKLLTEELPREQIMPILMRRKKHVDAVVSRAYWSRSL